MQNKKQVMVVVTFIVVILIGISYAYYEALVHGTGNTNAETNANTATLGEVEFNGVSTFDSSTLDDIYPGFIGIQTFTVGPAQDGVGIYEIDLAANVPTAFGNDLKLTLYKTSDKTNNYITRTEGTLTQGSTGFYKQDTITTTGSLTKVYEKNLTQTTETVLEQVEFTIDNDVFTTPIVTPDGYYTYYAVYEYINRETSQNSQQNLDFDAKITVKYIPQVTGKSDEALEQLHALNNSIVLSPSTAANPNFAYKAPLEQPGLVYEDLPISAPYVTYASDYEYNPDTREYTLVNYSTCELLDCYTSVQGKYVVGYMGEGLEISSDPYEPLTTGESIIKMNSIRVENEGSEGDYSTYAYVTIYTGPELYDYDNGRWAPQTTGIYALDDDYGTSYYFRGAPENNYVKFGGFYWKIIRINGDGSIRMIYAGDASVIDALPNKLQVLANGYNDSTTKYTQIGTSKFNSSSGDNAYIGYMYGTPGSNNYSDTHANVNSSTIKTYLDTWYENNLKNTSYEAYIADSIFCNDRSLAKDETITALNNEGYNYTKLGYGNNDTPYAPYGRITEEKFFYQGNKAILTCPNKNDRFSITDTIRGNGALTYPIGLMTSDEANVAGGIQTNYYDYTRCYLKTNNFYWLGSPFNKYYGENVAEITESGDIDHGSLSNTYGVRPVINLKFGSITAGAGTASNPFVVE